MFSKSIVLATAIALALSALGADAHVRTTYSNTDCTGTSTVSTNNTGRCLGSFGNYYKYHAAVCGLCYVTLSYSGSGCQSSNLIATVPFKCGECISFGGVNVRYNCYSNSISATQYSDSSCQNVAATASTGTGGCTDAGGASTQGVVMKCADFTYKQYSDNACTTEEYRSRGATNYTGGFCEGSLLSSSRLSAPGFDLASCPDAPAGSASMISCAVAVLAAVLAFIA